MTSVDVLRTYLEMRAPEALRPAWEPASAASLVVRRLERPTVEGYRALYAGVGERYHWRDRLRWSDEELGAHLGLRSVAVWILEVGGETAGYFELKRHFDDSVEIAYFGLLPAFVGRGLGGFLLTRAVEEAWAFGATRVWVHTCTLDHPAALSNYKARGMTEYRTESYRTEI